MGTSRNSGRFTGNEYLLLVYGRAFAGHGDYAKHSLGETLMLLLTGFNSAQAPLGELTAPLMESYAKRHRLGFRCVRFEAQGKEAYWQKIIETLRAFDEGFDRVFWLDADQAITNPEVPPPAFYEGYDPYIFLASRDWGNDAGEEDFSMCAYMAHPASYGMFEWVNERHDEFINGDFPEQTPMRLIAQRNRRMVQVKERKRFNAVPDEVSPGNVVEPWQPGDFAAHLTMLPVEERVALFHKIMARV